MSETSRKIKKSKETLKQLKKSRKELDSYRDIYTDLEFKTKKAFYTMLIIDEIEELVHLRRIRENEIREWFNGDKNKVKKG